MILISACLTGDKCRYDGRHALNQPLMNQLTDCWVAFCPEQLGGLNTPRSPAAIVGGAGADLLEGRAKALTAEKKDVTDAFIKGADIVLDLAFRLKAKIIYLKNKSPSCGLNLDINGKPGMGVCAARLDRAGFKLIEIESSGQGD